MKKELARFVGMVAAMSAVGLLLCSVAPAKADEALNTEEITIMGKAYGAMTFVERHCSDRYDAPRFDQFTTLIIAMYNNGDTRAYDAAMAQAFDNGAISGVQGADYTCDMLVKLYPPAFVRN